MYCVAIIGVEDGKVGKHIGPKDGDNDNVSDGNGWSRPSVGELDSKSNRGMYIYENREDSAEEILRSSGGNSL